MVESDVYETKKKFRKRGVHFSTTKVHKSSQRRRLDAFVYATLCVLFVVENSNECAINKNSVM
jgi:hypothetical protein